LFSRKIAIDDTMEALDDIFKQMNQSLSGQAKDLDKSLEPRVVSQKEDVVYIKNPPTDWAYHRVLNFKQQSVLALTISL